MKIDYIRPKDAKMYFSMSDPGSNAFANHETTPPSFNK